MISFSIDRPIQALRAMMPLHKQPAQPQLSDAPRLELHQPPAQDTVQFGWYGGGYYPSYQVQLDLREQYYEGFSPNKTIEQVLQTKAKPAVIIIDKPDDLAKYWKMLGMPKRYMPDVDWKNKAVVLVAQERTSSISAMPTSMSYERNRDELNVYLEGEKTQGRNNGMAWYMGVVCNGLSQNKEEEEAAKKRGWTIMNKASRLWMRVQVPRD